MDGLYEIRRNAESIRYFADGEETFNLGQWHAWKRECIWSGKTIPPKEFKLRYKRGNHTIMKAPKNFAKKFEDHPEGMCTLVLTRIIDKGTVFNPKKNKYVRAVLFVFESDKLMSEGDMAGKPFLVFQRANFSMYLNSHLCTFIGQLRGKRFTDQEDADAFDLASLLGLSVLANIAHNEGFVNIENIMPLPPGTKPLTPVMEVFALDMDNFDKKVFDKLSENMKDQIMTSKEYVAWEKSQGSQSGNVPTQSGNDPKPFDDSLDIPF